MTNTQDIKRQFLNALRRGTGEAFLLAKKYPETDFSNQVIKGALNIYAYDGQCEGNRAKYIFDLILFSRQQDKIRQAVLQGIATEKEDTWNLTHLFALAKLYAERGDVEMKQAIYDRFLSNPIEGSDWVGYKEILELDGLKGLFYISERFGRHIEQNPDDWQDDSIILHFQGENENVKVYEELKKKARSNKFIHIYLDNVKRTKASQKKHKTEATQYKDIIDEVLNSKPYISPVKRKNLSEREIKQIAEQLITETDKSNIEKLLRIFYFHKFPFNSNLILNLAKGKRTPKNKIVQYAIFSLRHLKSKSIRAFALDGIQNSKNPIDYLYILISNYRKGDYKLLNAVAEKVNNEHKIEQLAGIYTNIYSVNKIRECKEPLEILYKKMNCAIHRHQIIKILVENKVLSDQIKREIRFDCDPETRKLQC